MAEKSRRELLSEAFDEAENEVEPSEIKAEGRTTSDEGTSEQHTPPAVDEGTKESKGEVDEAKEGKSKPEEKEGKKTPDQLEAEAARRTDPKTVQKDPTSTITRAPNSWKPAEREAWANIPAEARAAILRREKDIEKSLSETAGIRKFSDTLARVVQPHLNNIQAAGTTPIAAIDHLLKTASGLQQGSADQKAQIIADLIANNSVDIKVLDGILSKRPLPGSGQQPPPNQNTIPAWAQPLFGFMNSAEQARQARDQELAESANAEIASAIEELPFFEDLKPDIADILEQAAKRGRVMTLKEGYERAAALDPEVSKIIEQRKLATRQQPSNMAGKRRAASTVSGGPSGSNTSSSKAKPGTRRAALAQAWDDAESR